MMNGLQSIEQWRDYFGNPSGSTLGVFNGAYPIGGIIATCFISVIADTFGRRWGIATGGIVCCIGAILQSTATNETQFVIGRAFIGGGSVLIQACGAPLITEIAHPKQRTTVTALYQTSYGLGSVVAAWITFGTFRISNSAAWRIPCALQALPSVIQIALIWFVPESPRWLVSKDRGEEALRMLAKYHAEGDMNDALVNWEFEEINNTLAIEKAADQGSFIANYLVFFKTPGNRHRIFLLTWCANIAQNSGNAIISYYLAPILATVGLTESLEQTLINATSQILSWLSAVYFATLPSKLGRRPLFLGAGVFVFSCLIAITTGSAVYAQDTSNKAAGIAVVAFIYLFSPAYNFGNTGNLGLYITEILPFSLRLRGMAVFQFWNLGFIALETFAIPVGLANLGWKFYFVFIAWVTVNTIGVYIFFPETKGPALEEIAAIFDGPNNAVLSDETHARMTAHNIDLEKSAPVHNETVAEK
jgi:sugar porter (SP) family MFS transporter